MVFSHPPHAILLIEGYISDSDNYIKNYLSQIVTDHGGDQQYLQKIANNTYYDMICLDCYTTSLKKEDVLTIIDRFQQQASEALGLKFYIIKGIENSSKEAINSLLKFIEEPLNNIYAVFTTRNVKAVVGTITSRCEQVIIKSDFTQLDLLIQKYNLTTEQVAIIKKVY
jgi:DNA polymerase-3 subunit delta'